MKVGDGWVHTWTDNDGDHELPVYGTPYDTGAIYDPRYPADPLPYCDHEWARAGATGNRFTFQEIHPNGIQPVDGKTFDH